MNDTTSHVTGLFHAGVTVCDMDEALRFYRDGLGLELVADGASRVGSASRIWNIEPERVRVVFLRVPGSDAMVELFEFIGIERHGASARPCDYGAGHFCLIVDDTDAIFERVTGMGFRARSETPITIEGGPHDGARVVYLIDPDGYHVELYQNPAGVPDIRERLGR